MYARARHLRHLLPALAALWFGLAHAADPLPRLRPFAIADQFGHTNRVVFPAPRPILLLMGDRRGYEQVDTWIPLLKDKWASDLEIVGLADVSAAPWFVRSRIIEGIRKKYSQPLLLDFEGALSRQLKGTPKLANVFLVHTNGQVLAHVAGLPEKESLEVLRRARGTAIAAP